jgi:hypothetical protein
MNENLVEGTYLQQFLEVIGWVIGISAVVHIAYSA